MSLHRNDFLVSAHQAEMQRHAADTRLAKTAKQTTSMSVTVERNGRIIGRLATGLVSAIRPVRRAAAEAVKAPGSTTIATSGSHS